MKQLLIIILSVLAFHVTNAQTIEQVDSLGSYTLANLDQYDCIEYYNQKDLGEDAVGYDTVKFYHKKNGDLVYMNWRDRSHYFHIQGDRVRISELFLIKNTTVLRRISKYSFDNSQWHKEPDQDRVKVTVIESIRQYYKQDGSPLGSFESRKAQGEFKDRFTLLNSIPLEKERKLFWPKRCDECLEKDYLKLYRKLLKEKADK